MESVCVKVSQTESGLQNAFGITYGALLDVDLPLSDVCWRNIKITADLITSKNLLFCQVKQPKHSSTLMCLQVSFSVYVCVHT